MKPKSREPIYLIGVENSQILSAKLPSNRQVLSVLFYNFRNVHRELHESASLVIKEVSIFWEKSSIPMRESQHAISKLKKLYKSWNELKKSRNRNTETQRNNEQHFVDSLDNLFDIGHADAFELMKSEDDKQFYIAQKKREGCLMGLDKKEMDKEKRVADRIEKVEMRKRKYEIEQQRVTGKISNIGFMLNESSKLSNIIIF